MSVPLPTAVAATMDRVRRITAFRLECLSESLRGRDQRHWHTGTFFDRHVRESLAASVRRLREIREMRCRAAELRLIVNPVAAQRMAASAEVRGYLAAASPWGPVHADVWGLPAPTWYGYQVQVETALLSPEAGGGPPYAVADDEAFLAADSEPGVGCCFTWIFGGEP